jgi:hypothetical protein
MVLAPVRFATFFKGAIRPPGRFYEHPGVYLWPASNLRYCGTSPTNARFC